MMKREFVRHTIRVRFAAGPRDGATATVDTLDPIKLFFDVPTRRVDCYQRDVDEMYLWSPGLSAAMSGKGFDEAYERWGQHDTIALRRTAA